MKIFDVNICYDGQGWTGSSDVLNSLTQSKIYEPIKKFKITFLMQESKWKKFASNSTFLENLSWKNCTVQCYLSQINYYLTTILNWKIANLERSLGPNNILFTFLLIENYCGDKKKLELTPVQLNLEGYLYFNFEFDYSRTLL